jgi:hypothetical protein
MSHPFEVGKPYRNRAGEYIVQEIVGNQMVIRYTDGRTLTTSVAIQARIWENIHFEKQLAREEERKQQAREARQAARRRTARRKARPKFEGFEEADFEPKTRGIAWKTRKELGKVLAFELGQRTKESYGHWIVPRQSKVHVAQDKHYDRERRETNAALFVSAHEAGLDYGLRMGKPRGRTKASWHWSLLLKALAGSKPVRQAIHSAMETHNLALDVYAMQVSYGQVARITAEGKGFMARQEDEEQEVTRPLSREELADYLKDLPSTKRCDLYLYGRLSPQEAQKAGSEIPAEILRVMESLLPVYSASVGA